MNIKSKLLSLVIGLLVTSSVAAQEFKASEKDVLELSRVTYAESLNESQDGKMAVVWVVINRVNTKGFPGTIHSVLFQKRAFSCLNGGGSKLMKKAMKFTLNTDNKKWQEAVADVRKALSDGPPAYMNGIVFYREKNCKGGAKTFNKLIYSFQIGNHKFYKEA